MIKIAVLGYGTIGSGVVEVIETNREVLTKRAGDELSVKYVLDLRDFPGDPIQDRIVHDFSVIENDPEVAMVVEAMGGVEPAFTFAKKALLAGKHFATSNKALIADKGAELLAIAREKNVNCMFEASVGGGIPIIRPIRDCLTAEVIEEISGILNGTTNYMLTKMFRDGAEFEDVLKEAQRLGYAEADPTADIEGHDPCRKIAILTSLICGQQVNYTDIPTEGITSVSATDIKYAKAMNMTIKLLASSYKTGDTYCAMVAPFMLPATHPLYSVNDVFNAVFVRGNMLGDAMFYGSGAGKLMTASAVVADIVDIARHLDENIPVEWKPEKLELADARSLCCKYFVRTVADKAHVEAAFGEVSYAESQADGEIAFMTEEMDGYAFEKASEKMGGLIWKIRVK